MPISETVMLRLTPEQLVALRHAVSRWTNPAVARDSRYTPILQTLEDRLDMAEAMVVGLTGSRPFDERTRVRIATPAQRPAPLDSPRPRDALATRDEDEYPSPLRANASGEQECVARS